MYGDGGWEEGQSSAAQLEDRNSPCLQIFLLINLLCGTHDGVSFPCAIKYASSFLFIYLQSLKARKHPNIPLVSIWRNLNLTSSRLRLREMNFIKSSDSMLTMI